MATFPVTYQTHTNTIIQCKAGPLSGGTNIVVLNIVKLGPNELTYGPIDKTLRTATIYASVAEWNAVLNATTGVSAAHPVNLVLTLDPADGRFANVTSIYPEQAVAVHAVLRSIQNDVSAISPATGAINERLMHDLPLVVQQLQQLLQLVRIGLRKLNIPDSELPAAALDVSYAHPSDRPTADSEIPSAPAYVTNGNTLEQLVPPGRLGH